MSLTAAERETIITLNDADGTIHINTSQRPWITKILRNKNAEILSDEMFGTTRIVSASLPAGSISLRNKGKGQGVKREGVGKRLSTAARCGADKADGTKCKMVAKKDTGKCRWHS